MPFFANLNKILPQYFKDIVYISRSLELLAKSEVYNPQTSSQDFSPGQLANQLAPLVNQTQNWNTFPYYTQHQQSVLRTNMPRQPTNKPRRSGGRKPKEEEIPIDKMSPQEREKKLKRRERNKEAAARCRQRRIDTMNDLQGQLDEMRRQNDHKDRIIQELQQQKNHLEQLCKNHGCKLTDSELDVKNFNIPSTTTTIVTSLPSRMITSSNGMPMVRVMRTSKNDLMDAEPTLAAVNGNGSEMEIEKPIRPSALSFDIEGLTHLYNWSNGTQTSQNGPGVQISTPSNMGNSTGFTPILQTPSFVTPSGVGGPLGASTGLTPTANPAYQAVTSLETPVSLEGNRELKSL